MLSFLLQNKLYTERGDKMASLKLTDTETKSLEIALRKMEEKFGNEYSFKPEISEFSCRCSGPAQSCTWH